MKKKSLVSIVFLLIATGVFSQVKKNMKLNDTLEVTAILIHHENFDTGLSSWLMEIEPSDDSEVSLINGKLDIDVAAGCSVWFKERMEGNVLIEFDAILIEQGGINDNVQDLNTYWMANDPKHPDDIFNQSEVRGGKYRSYFPLSLYYVGLGETQNRRSRLRRYDGSGKRPWLPEHDLTDSEFLLRGNQLYKIKIISFGGSIQYYRNDELLFELIDPTPFTSGHFCFRTVKNHMRIDDFKVYQLE